MPWKIMEVREQRVRFVVAAARKEQSFLQLCQEFGISRPTGYAWLERYRREGIEGIRERSRRPQRIPRQTARELERLVVQQRLRYPDWGARKLQVLLCREGVTLTRSTIHRILLRYDLVRTKTAAPKRCSALNAPLPMNFGRWILKGRRDGPVRSALSPCSTITAASCLC